MLNVGCQPNDRVISHWQDASSTGTLRSACATDSPSMQNHLPDYSELHILRQWDHSFSHNNQFIRTPWLTLVALAKLAWVCVPSREQYERQNTPPSLPLTRRHYWTKIDDTPWVSHSPHLSLWPPGHTTRWKGAYLRLTHNEKNWARLPHKP